ncbi:hypothetical protein CQA49_09655 [Helicobacter sp. MIT 00-7814]|uniref:hypothetical protein n=1 Tax=unclassified Helicobacter TaxID=2593540 RepID=UPI000E1E64EF|nr:MULTISPECIES: hypothetical protein [unclassified Helicobacter]RDU51398.1 hypothetical protein CQA49_09655 [Helicobacter sp. MIT 00-7814]RDU51526.1 hypothetical protein CQA37_09645 [Helicobacter sp. MIT 99-10781]
MEKFSNFIKNLRDFINPQIKDNAEDLTNDLIDFLRKANDEQEQEFLSFACSCALLYVVDISKQKHINDYKKHSLSQLKAEFRASTKLLNEESLDLNTKKEVALELVAIIQELQNRQSQMQGEIK